MKFLERICKHKKKNISFEYVRDIVKGMNGWCNSERSILFTYQVPEYYLKLWEYEAWAPGKFTLNENGFPEIKGKFDFSYDSTYLRWAFKIFQNPRILVPKREAPLIAHDDKAFFLIAPRVEAEVFDEGRGQEPEKVNQIDDMEVFTEVILEEVARKHGWELTSIFPILNERKRKTSVQVWFKKQYDKKEKEV